ncbi:MAG: hypothetical protein ACTHK2_04610 [Dokdonella sp.]|uniref:hypothetical protein n=1 Tax=Dokdonella sp. TaxID=2291710 RepID=UPI003F7EAD26
MTARALLRLIWRGVLALYAAFRDAFILALVFSFAWAICAAVTYLFFGETY